MKANKPQKELFKDERPPRIITPAARAETEASNLALLMRQFDDLRDLYEKAKLAYWSLRAAAGIARELKHPEAIRLMEARR